MGRHSDARERLIAAGRQAMHERGYTAVGVNEICTRAAVNKGSFYHFFPTKRTLGLAVIDGYAEQLDASLGRMLGDAGPPLERLRRFLEGGYRRLREQQDENGGCLGCALGNLALELAAQDHVLRERLREVFDGWVRAYATLIDEAIERGDLAPGDAKRAAESLVALHEGRILLAKLRDDPDVMRGLGDEAMRVLGASNGPAAAN